MLKTCQDKQSFRLRQVDPFTIAERSEKVERVARRFGLDSLFWNPHGFFLSAESSKISLSGRRSGTKITINFKAK